MDQIFGPSCTKRKHWCPKQRNIRTGNSFGIGCISDRFNRTTGRTSGMEIDVESYSSSSATAKIKRAQNQIFSRHKKGAIGCISCIGKGLEVANGQSQVDHAVRLLAYNRNQANEFYTNISELPRVIRSVDDSQKTVYNLQPPQQGDFIRYRKFRDKINRYGGGQQCHKINR